MNRQHRYAVRLEWTGDRGAGTASYGGYSRNHVLQAEGKPPIEGSSDPSFRGDPARWNPEELLLASLSACPCHQLFDLDVLDRAVMPALDSPADRGSNCPTSRRCSARSRPGTPSPA